MYRVAIGYIQLEGKFIQLSLLNFCKLHLSEEKYSALYVHGVPFGKYLYLRVDFFSVRTIVPILFQYPV